MSDDFKVFQNRADMNVIFVHSELDDRNLSVAEFRVYCHLARRSGGGKAWPGIDSIARICNISKNTVTAAIRSLESQKMLTAERAAGVNTRYILTRFGEWTPLPELGRYDKPTVPKEVTERPNSDNATVPKEVTERPNSDNATVPKEVTKGNPLKVIQEGNPRERTIFVKPSIDEIKLQCAKIGLPEAEAEGFFYSHESKGWKIGNSPMVSWPAALQTWKRNHEKFGTRNNGFQKPKLVPDYEKGF